MPPLDLRGRDGFAGLVGSPACIALHDDRFFAHRGDTGRAIASMMPATSEGATRDVYNRLGVYCPPSLLFTILRFDNNSLRNAQIRPLR